MIEKIRQYPDQVLLRVCEEVQYDAKDRFIFKRLINALDQNQRQRLAVAAPQIGVLRRAFSYRLTQFREELEDGFPAKGVAVNPVITSFGSQLSVVEEGCLSLRRPERIRRPSTILVEFDDPKKNHYSFFMRGMSARVFQHEIDHLDGILIIDRVDGGPLAYERQSDSGLS